MNASLYSHLYYIKYTLYSVQINEISIGKRVYYGVTIPFYHTIRKMGYILVVTKNGLCCIRQNQAAIDILWYYFYYENYCKPWPSNKFDPFDNWVPFPWLHLWNYSAYIQSEIKRKIFFDKYF